MEWIKLILSFVTGFGSCGIIQFFVNRNDNKKDKSREKLGQILHQLSLFGNSLHKAYNAWSDNINKLEPLLDKHVEELLAYKTKHFGLKNESNRLMEKYAPCMCENAPTCPHRIVGETPKDIEELVEKSNKALADINEQQQEFVKGCIAIIDAITPALDEYADFLSHIPEAYLLPTKVFKKIYPALSLVEQSNNVISQRIRSMKAEPQYLGDKNNSLRIPIAVAIEAVEKAKLIINNTLETL